MKHNVFFKLCKISSRLSFFQIQIIIGCYAIKFSFFLQLVMEKSEKVFFILHYCYKEHSSLESLSRHEHSSQYQCKIKKPFLKFSCDWLCKNLNGNTWYPVRVQIKERQPRRNFMQFKNAYFMQDPGFLGLMRNIICHYFFRVSQSIEMVQLKICAKDQNNKKQFLE